MPAFHMKRSLLVLPIQMFCWLCFRWYLIWISNCACWLEEVVKDTSSIWRQLVIFSTTKIKQTAPKMISWKLWLGSIVSRAVILSSFAGRAKVKPLKLFFRWWRSRKIGKIHHSHVRKTTYTWHITQWLTIHVLLSEKWEVFFGTTTTMFQCFPAAL